MSLDQYNLVEVIGKGSYGEVWLAKHKKDRKQYVLKKMDLRKASKRERKAAELEAQLLSAMKHPNIVAYKESFEADDGFLYIAMGFCDGGDLYSRLKQQKGVLLEERQVVEWFVQIAMALQYMHERNIMHRDLKTQNIFLTKSKVIKVGDLGIARVLDSATDMATTMIGTPYYMSPELFSNKPYNFKSDVWALGCCVYEMTTLKHAFNGKDMNALMYKILRGRMPPMPSAYTTELVNLIHAMLNKTADKRPSVNRILRDPYIKKNIALFLEETRSTNSSRQSSARSTRDRPTSAPVGKKAAPQSDRPDSASSQSRSPAKAKKVSRPPAVAESLEPLHIGPDLEPITEEPTPRESIDVMSAFDDLAPAGAPLPVSRPSSCTPGPEASHNDDGNAQIPCIRRRRKNQNARKPYSVDGTPAAFSAAEAARYSVRELPPYVSKPKVNGQCVAKPPVIASHRLSCGDARGMNDEASSRLVPAVPDSTPVDIKSLPVVVKPAWNPPEASAASGDANRLACVQIDVVTENNPDLLPKPMPSPRVLPPRPSMSRNPEVSRARPVSGRSSGDSGQASASSGSSSNSSNATDDVITPASGDRRPATVLKSTDIETPRTSSARERRRRKKEVEDSSVACSVELPSARSCYGRPVVSKSYQVSSGYSSLSDVTDIERSSKPAGPVHTVVTQVNSAPGQLNHLSAAAGGGGGGGGGKSGSGHHRNSSAGDGEENSSTGSSSDVEQADKSNGEKKGNRDMKALITLLSSTLQLGKQVKQPLQHDSEPAVPVAKKSLSNLGQTYVKSTPSGVRVPSIDPVYEEEFENSGPAASEQAISDADLQAHIESGFSVTTGGRLLDRITFLRKDCIHRLGVKKLKFAYDIIDNFTTEDVEPHLVRLLGQDDFDEFAGKIYQLKFYEESAFGAGGVD